MNYYPHHIGDYAQATRHLTMVEHGAYRLMLDLYYSREAALPVDVATVQRLACARTREERAAIEQVLREFFVETPEGWKHSRCEMEIDKARQAGEGGEQRRENEKERQRRHRGRRKTLFEQLREHGVVPPFDASSSSLQRLLDDAVSRAQGVTDNAPVTRDITQTQRLTNPNPNKTPLTPLEGGAGDRVLIDHDPPPGPLPPPAVSPAVQLAIAAREAGVPCQGSDPRLIALAEQGVAVPTLLAAIAEAVGAKGSAVSLGYVVAVLNTWAAQAAKVSANGAAQPMRGGGVIALPSAATPDEALLRRISETHGGESVTRLPDGRMRCGGRYYRPDGREELAI